MRDFRRCPITETIQMIVVMSLALSFIVMVAVMILQGVINVVHIKSFGVRSTIGIDSIRRQVYEQEFDMSFLWRGY